MDTQIVTSLRIPDTDELRRLFEYAYSGKVLISEAGSTRTSTRVRWRAADLRYDHRRAFAFGPTLVFHFTMEYTLGSCD